MAKTTSTKTNSSLTIGKGRKFAHPPTSFKEPLAMPHMRNLESRTARAQFRPTKPR